MIFCGLCVCYSATAEQNFTFGTIGHATNSVYTAGGSCAGRAVYGSACLASFVETSNEIDNHYPFSFSFSTIPKSNSVYTAGGSCAGRAVYGSACLTSFVETSNEIDNHYPFSFSFSTIPSSVNNYKKMLDQDCLGTKDGYYKITMNRFSKPTDSQCADGTIPYEILNDCQHIDMSEQDETDIRSPLHPDNYMCAVLCDSGFEYSNIGKCLEYCKLDGEVKRFHIQHGDTHIAIPLWKNSYTTPGVHIRFSNKQVCHMNLTTEKKSNTLNVLYQDTVYYGTK